MVLEPRLSAIRALNIAAGDGHDLIRDFVLRVTIWANQPHVVYVFMVNPVNSVFACSICRRLMYEKCNLHTKVFTGCIETQAVLRHNRSN